VNALLKAVQAKTERSAAVRIAAVEALVAIGDSRAKAELAKVAESDPNEKVRRAAKRFH
jgi:HEAT repeat protein